ncbi:ATP-dependent Clp protease adaptor ClpS [Helicobacter pylori]
MHQIPTPTMSQVIMLNDSITTAEFMVSALRDFFDKPLEEAQELMLSIHRDGDRDGDGVCGVYPYEIAIYKAVCVRDKARALRFPLRLMVQEVK